MPTEATDGSTTTPKVEESEAPSAVAAVPAKKPRKKRAEKATTGSSSVSNKPSTTNRVTKPSSRTKTGTRLRNKTLRGLADAADEANNGGNSSNSSNSSNNTNSGNSSNSAAPIPSLPSPPPPAADVFPELPDDANPIDRAILARITTVWDEDAHRWTEAMQRSLLAILPRARVSRTTANLANHYVTRTVRQSGREPTWGEFVAVRAMFGPGACFRQPWALDFAARFPLAREDSYEGVVPAGKQTIQDVLDGNAGLPMGGRRKESIMRMASQKTRKRKAKVMTKEGTAVTTAAVAVRKREDAGWKMERQEEQGSENGEKQQEEEEDVVLVNEAAWEKAAVSARTMDPKEFIEKLRSKYSAQEAQIRSLRASNDAIRKSLLSFNSMVAMVKDEL